MSMFSIGPGQFRLLLAALVVFSHMSPFEIGRPAVFAFFALSGYWVMRMYAEKYRPVGGIWYFYVSRILRIWLPFATAYFLVILCYELFAVDKPLSVLWGLSLLGLASTGHDVLGTSWSLDIELQFYLAVPVLFAILSRPLSMSLLIGCVAALCVIGWALQLVFEIWTFLSYLPAFVAGALIWRHDFRPPKALVWGGVALFVIVGTLVFIVPETHALLRRDMLSPFHEDWFGMIWVGCLIPFIAHNVHQPSSSFDMHLGNFSFALYITHWPIIALIRPMLNPLSIADRIMILLVIIAISVAFYVIVDRTLERVRKHVLDWVKPNTV